MPRTVNCDVDGNPQKLKRVLIPIGTGSEEIETVCVADTLNRFGAKVVIASVMADGNLMCSMSQGVTIKAEMTMEKASLEEWDLIVLPGGIPGAERLRECPSLITLLKKHKEQNKLYGAICAAPAVVLAYHGFVDKGATCYPASIFRDDLDDWKDEPVVVQGNLVTSQGPGTALKFALQLGEMLFDKQKADEIAKNLLVERVEAAPPKPAPQAKVTPAGKTAKKKSAPRTPVGSPVAKAPRKVTAKKMTASANAKLQKAGKPANGKTPPKAPEPEPEPEPEYKSRSGRTSHKPQSIYPLVSTPTPTKKRERTSTPTTTSPTKKKKPSTPTKTPTPKSTAKSTPRSTPQGTKNGDLFLHIIWPTLIKAGWKKETGNRPNDNYYVPPGVSRTKGFKNRKDYFDSVSQVFHLLHSDDKWSKLPSVKTAVKLYDDCVELKNELRASNKLPKGCSPEWIVERVEGQSPGKRVRVAAKTAATTTTPAVTTPVKNVRTPPSARSTTTKTTPNVTLTPISTKTPPKDLFTHILWPTLKQLGWNKEPGSRPTDVIYFPPGVTRGKGFKRRVDYFESLSKVISLLKTDAKWKTNEMIQRNLKLLEECVALRERTNGKEKNDPEWLVKEVVSRQPFQPVGKVVTQGTNTPESVGKGVPQSKKTPEMAAQSKKTPDVVVVQDDDEVENVEVLEMNTLEKDTTELVKQMDSWEKDMETTEKEGKRLDESLKPNAKNALGTLEPNKSVGTPENKAVSKATTTATTKQPEKGTPEKVMDILKETLDATNTPQQTTVPPIEIDTSEDDAPIQPNTEPNKPPTPTNTTSPSSPLSPGSLFLHIVWPTLAKLGWKKDIGNRPNDTYFLPPGVTRSKGFKCRKDFFDSLSQVHKLLDSDEKWSKLDAIKTSLRLYDDCVELKNRLKKEKKLPKGCDSEWLVGEVNKKGKPMYI